MLGELSEQPSFQIFQCSVCYSDVSHYIYVDKHYNAVISMIISVPWTKVLEICWGCRAIWVDCHISPKSMTLSKVPFAVTLCDIHGVNIRTNY